MKWITGITFLAGLTFLCRVWNWGWARMIARALKEDWGGIALLVFLFGTFVLIVYVSCG